MTTSQVSMETREKPSCSAASTSAAAPWLNHSVRMRRMSCRLSPEPAPAACISKGLGFSSHTAQRQDVQCVLQVVAQAGACLSGQLPVRPARTCCSGTVADLTRI
jgi:hypothetical protein